MSTIWGWSDPGETVKIVTSWNSKDTIKVKGRQLLQRMENHHSKPLVPVAPTPFRFWEMAGVKLNNVMLGEVWVCSGQSNMEMSVNWKLINGEEEAAKANNPNIRIFHVQKIGADYPQQTCNATWTLCTPETMRATSAAGYFFARELQQKLNVPVGIIVSAWGGTPAEVWIEKSRIENNPELNKNKHSAINSQWWPGSPGTLIQFDDLRAFCSLWNCWSYLVPGRIELRKLLKFIHQLMKTLIENWRADFKKDFPFYLVQIAPFDYGDKGTSEYIREQEDIVAKTVPNTGMVVITDLVDNIKDIHPKDKLNVGKRLANYALAETYKQNVGAYKSPAYQSMQVEKDKVRLTFSNILTGLKCTAKTPERFLIAGDDQKFVPATAKIEGSTIVLSSKLVKTPVAVRFCFDDTTMPDVFSTEGLPLAPFRTDKW